MQTAGVIAGAGLTAVGAAATFGGSAAVQAAIDGTRAAAEGATAEGRIANDLVGAGGFAPGAPASGGGGSDLPEPPRLAPATVGESYENPSNPAQVAHQAAADSFTVTDSARRTISTTRAISSRPTRHRPRSIRIPRRRNQADRRRCRRPKPYEILRTQATPSPRESDRVARATPTPKPPPPIPQTIFATREQSVSEWFLPYGRLLRCELMNTVDSTNIDTPIIGLVIEDAWNDGRLIVPAGTEVHGVAQKSPVRERIGSDRQWFLVFQDGRELPISGTVLDYAPDPKKPDSWAESDGSAGLRGFVVKSDKYAEAKAILAAMISAGAGAFPETTTLISPLGGATQLNNGGIDSAFSAGLQAGGQMSSKRLLERLDKDPFYVRVPAGTTFYLYVTQTVDLGKATIGLSASIPPPNNPTPIHP